MLKETIRSETRLVVQQGFRLHVQALYY